MGLEPGSEYEWEIEMHSFITTSASMRLNITHSIPNLSRGNVGTESTLLDDFRITKLD